MTWCTDQLGLVQNPTNSKLLCTKTFMVFIWGHLEANPTLTSQKQRISFFHKTPHQAIYICRGAPTNLVMFKTQPTQNFCAPRISWYSFGGIWRPIQSSHLKTTNFIFSQNSPPSNLAMLWCTNQLGHVQNPTNSKLLCTKTFMVFIWGNFDANPTLTSQKPRISFFHKTPHQAI